MQRRDIRDLPAGKWRFPPDRWLVTLRRADGTREWRTVRGDVGEARVQVRAMLRHPYVSAWFRETA